MKIFFTGGTGFIGRQIVKRLKDKHELAILTSQENLKKEDFKNIQIYYGDLSDKRGIENIITNFKPDSAIHLAWEGISKGDYSLNQSIINFENSLNFLKSLSKTNCKKIIIAGSDQEYGMREGRLSEDMPTISINPFTTAKNCLNNFGREISKEMGADFYWLRIFYIYGLGQKKGLLYNILKNIKEEKVPEIKTPFSKHDFIYVEDVARVFIDLQDKIGGGIYNVGSGYSTSVRDFVNTTYRLMGMKYDNFPKEQKQISDRWADISKIKRGIRWEPKISLEEGIKLTIEDLKLKREL